MRGYAKSGPIKSRITFLHPITGVRKKTQFNKPLLAKTAKNRSFDKRGGRTRDYFQKTTCFWFGHLKIRTQTIQLLFLEKIYNTNNLVLYNRHYGKSIFL